MSLLGASGEGRLVSEWPYLVRRCSPQVLLPGNNGHVFSCNFLKVAHLETLGRNSLSSSDYNNKALSFIMVTNIMHSGKGH